MKFTKKEQWEEWLNDLRGEQLHSFRVDTAPDGTVVQLRVRLRLRDDDLRRSIVTTVLTTTATACSPGPIPVRVLTSRKPLSLLPWTPPTLDIVAAIINHRFHFTDESELQSGLATVLKNAGIDAEREVRLSASNRIDFMVGCIGIEVKVDGSLSALIRQCMRYAQCDEVYELLIVTTRAQHSQMPPTLSGKPVTVCHLGGNGF